MNGRGPEQRLRVEEISTLEGLERLRGPWERLYERVASTTTFQHPAWMISWWKHLGTGRLRVLAFWNEASLSGLLPFYEHEGTTGLLGEGISDYLDALVEPGALEAVERALSGQLRQRARATDIEFDFRELRPDSTMLKLRLAGAVTTTLGLQSFCPGIVLSPEGRHGARGLPQEMDSRLAYYRRRWTRFEQVRLEAVGPESAPEYIECLIELHGARWRERGEPGVLHDRRVQAFHREAAPELCRQGAAVLYGLRHAGKVVGCLYLLRRRDWAGYYLSGYDPELARVSPGTLLIGHAMEEAAKAGAREFDFLRGREPYKYKWGAIDRPSFRWVLSTRRGDGQRTSS